MNDYSQRYGIDYQKRVGIAMHHHRKLNGGICCCCLVRQAKEMHHTSYGSDRFGSNWFPVCIFCHRQICHNKKNWVRYFGEKALFGNQNNIEFVNLLRYRFKILTSKN